MASRMINLTMRHGNGELLRKAIAQGLIVTARTSIPKELKSNSNAFHPKAPITLWLKQGDTSKLHATGTARVIENQLFLPRSFSPWHLWDKYAEQACFSSGQAWFFAFRSFHPRWKGGTVYFVEITGIEERSAR